MYKRKLHPNFHQGAASLLSFFLLSFFSFALTLIVPSYPPPFSRHYLRPSFAFSLPRTSVYRKCLARHVARYEEESTPFAGVSSVSGARYEKSSYESVRRERERELLLEENIKITLDTTNAWFVLLLFFFYFISNSGNLLIRS